ncbi:argonaute PAZ domain-containing protein [Gloeomargarita sp.]
MNLSTRAIPVVLNRFLIKQLTGSDLEFYEYECHPLRAPKSGDEYRAISRICYQLGITAVRLGSRIITREQIASDKMQIGDWTLRNPQVRNLTCSNGDERKALECFYRRELEKDLRRKYHRTSVIERADEGGLIWWIKSETEIHGDGWEVHRGRRIDVAIDQEGSLYLEIDIHHRFYTPWTLEQWLKKYTYIDIPIKYVRNTYKDGDNSYIRWQYEGLSDESPYKVILSNINISLADYHRNKGATEDEINSSRVVYVRKVNDWKGKPLPHLSQRLSPSLTMEMLASIAVDKKQGINDVLRRIRKKLVDRLKESRETATTILREIYEISGEAQPLGVEGYLLPRPKLVARQGQVEQVAKVRYKGCVGVGETKFGYLNLFDESREYPVEVSKCLSDIAKKSGVEIDINSCYTQRDLPESELEQQNFWQSWSGQGVKTVLVLMDWSPEERKKRIRAQALGAGIATQFMVPTRIPNSKADEYKALNVVLGLLCKAGWQIVHLQAVNHPEAADLIIGFDTGTNRQLYYGVSAFAVLSNGQSLGWELPDVQRGEAFSGEAIWQTVSKLVRKFHQKCHHYPKKLLLMRDGLVQADEFEKTTKELKKANIAVDVVSVRKSGTGRMGILDKGMYQDAKIGTVVFAPQEKSFTLITTQAVFGSARPLRVVHTHGNTSLELLALQTYHLSQLHPASGFCACRLPWVLHLADKSGKEFQRLGQMSLWQNINREKLIAV